eukprot:UN26361
MPNRTMPQNRNIQPNDGFMKQKHFGMHKMPLQGFFLPHIQSNPHKQQIINMRAAYAQQQAFININNFVFGNLKLR